VKIVFSFPGGFFFSMMIPQDFIHLNLSSSSGSFLGIKNLNGSFDIR
jgi:hypothetical protein